MKISFNCNSGANIHSKRTEVFDLEKDLNITEEEWNSWSEEDKQKTVEDWAWERLEIYWEELND